MATLLNDYFCSESSWFIRLWIFCDFVPWICYVWRLSENFLKCLKIMIWFVIFCNLMSLLAASWQRHWAVCDHQTKMCGRVSWARHKEIQTSSQILPSSQLRSLWFPRGKWRAFEFHNRTYLWTWALIRVGILSFDTDRNINLTQHIFNISDAFTKWCSQVWCIMCTSIIR